MPRPGRFFVNQLLPECEDQDLKKYFSKFGKITQANVLIETETLMSRCCGWVSVFDDTILPNVLKEEHSIWDQPFKAKSKPDPEDGDNLGAPGIAPATAAAGLAPAGNVVPGKFGKGGKSIPQGSKGGVKGFQAPAGAQSAAIQEDTWAADGYDGTVADAPESALAGTPGWFIVSRLAPEAGEDEVHGFFSAFGDVEELQLMKDPSGQSKLSAYVKMVDPEVLIVILSQEEYDMDGTTIAVKAYESLGSSQQSPQSKGTAGKKGTSYGSVSTAAARATYGKGCAAQGGYDAAAEGGYGYVGKGCYKGDKGKGPYGAAAKGGKDGGVGGKDAMGEKGKGAYGDAGGFGKESFGKNAFGKDGFGKGGFGYGCGKDAYGKDGFGKGPYGGKEGYGKFGKGFDAYGPGMGW